MILFPAIDLKDGTCVRLVRGHMASATVFNRDPAAQARQFADAGFSWLHVVDLDGAVAGRSVNGAAVTAIRSAVDLPIQLGGGVRDRAAIARQIRIPLIASGGVSSLDDIAALKEREADGIAGISCGRALYDGRIHAASALRLLLETPPC